MPSNQQRRDAAKRKLQRQLVRRQQRAVAQRRRLMIVGVVAAVLVIAGGVWFFTSRGSSSASASGDSTTGASSGAPSSVATSSTGPSTPCSYPTGGQAAKLASPPTNLSPANTGTVDATVKMTTGTLTFALDRANAPCAVESFLSLASQNYFNHTECHRLTTAATLKVLQCGDPSGTGAGGPGYTFADELTGKEKYTAGTIAMANSGADTNGSQFFIVYGDSTLQPDYTVLGKVTSGLDVVDAIAAKGAQKNGQPASDGTPVEQAEIDSVTIPAGSVEATGSYATGTASATGSPLPSSAVPTDAAPSSGAASTGGVPSSSAPATGAASSSGAAPSTGAASPTS